VLLYLTQYLAQFESGFNVFNYLTMRAILGALTALVLSFIIGPRMIARLSVNQLGQPVREEGPDTHLLKAGTPTMGGALILTAIAVSTVLWADLENAYVWIVLFVTLSFGVIGYVDDYKKLVLQDPAGISATQKLFWQSCAALVAAVALYVTATDEVQTSLLIPYFKDLAIPLGLFQVVVTYFFIVGFSNAVNLTDRATSIFRDTLAYLTLRGRARFWFSARRWQELVWDSCGSTLTRPRCSWETSVPCRSEPHWA
jgi:phospho-N-acetylmuramoyl-pentapeptide-transferase